MRPNVRIPLWAHLEAAVALHFMYYKLLSSSHQTLRVTPAMEVGVAKKLWSVEDIVGLLGQRKSH